VQKHTFAIAQACQDKDITHVVICPGSRSAPLLYAFVSNKHFKCISIVDERSAAYTALGMAQQLKKPVVLICTSGTATLNFHPAIAEAFYQRIPLIVLTADRPPEFLNKQDGQMVNQQYVFAQHTRSSRVMPCYTALNENLQEAYSITEECIAQASQPCAGPVHINVPLSEPLYTAHLLAPRINYIKQKCDALAKNNKDEVLISMQAPHTKRLILVGQLPTNATIAGALQQLQHDNDTVIITDVLSNQFGYNTASRFDYLLSRADDKMRLSLKPDFIISFGGGLVSKKLRNFLSSISPKYHLRLDNEGMQIDTYNNVTHFLSTNEVAQTLHKLSLYNQAEPSYFKLFWQQSGLLCNKAVESFLLQPRWSEPHAMQRIFSALPSGANVHLGNSSVIRHAATAANISCGWVMSGNRGTSGIDGCTSTAIGAARVNNRETFLITGDVAFLYDFQAWMQPNLPDNLKVIVLNNGGGRIFDWIPGPDLHPHLLPFFNTPHQHNIGKLLQALHIPHTRVESIKSLEAAIYKWIEKPGPAVLECVFNHKQNLKTIKQFDRLIL
jgi:2-succinyl-5-enolpyruvyl-6-hydroxy-3-cyclohexene-1-carboxylate synthase